MIIDTEVLNSKSLYLIEKYGREAVIRAERLALEQANAYRALTDAWINCFLRERDVFCRVISRDANKKCEFCNEEIEDHQDMVSLKGGDYCHEWCKDMAESNESL